MEQNPFRDSCICPGCGTHVAAFARTLAQAESRAKRATEQCGVIADEWDKDAAQLAAARAEVVALLAEVERLRAELEVMQAACQWVPDDTSSMGDGWETLRVVTEAGQVEARERDAAVTRAEGARARADALLVDLIAATERERHLLAIVVAAEDMILAMKQALYSGSPAVMAHARERLECPPYLPSVYRDTCQKAGAVMPDLQTRASAP